MIKNTLITAIWLTVFLCTFLGVQGCLVIWSDEVFVGTLFKTVDANDINLTADANSIQIGSGRSETKNDKIEAYIPSVGVIKANQ